MKIFQRQDPMLKARVSICDWWLEPTARLVASGISRKDFAQE